MICPYFKWYLDIIPLFTLHAYDYLWSHSIMAVAHNVSSYPAAEMEVLLVSGISDAGKLKFQNNVFQCYYWMLKILAQIKECNSFPFLFFRGNSYPLQCRGDKLSNALRSEDIQHIRAWERNLTGWIEETAGLWQRLYVRSLHQLILLFKGLTCNISSYKNLKIT